MTLILSSRSREAGAALLMTLLAASCRGEGSKGETAPQDTSPIADTSPGIADEQFEICGNGLDDDLDGSTDEAEDCDTGRSASSALDEDGDGYAREGREDDDCDDSDPRVNPGATEICDDIDNDCDGEIDEATGATIPGCISYLRDDDGDGFGDDGNSSSCSCEPMEGWVLDGGDCDDTSADAADHHPGATPTCDGFADDDCDGLDDDEEMDEAMVVPYGSCADEPTFCGRDDDGSCVDWYLDNDGDGEGDAEEPRCLCEAGDELQGLTGYSSSDLDCDDYDVTYQYLLMYQDNDEDGYGDEALEADTLCEVDKFYAPNNRDCNDGSDEINPSVPEVCKDGGSVDAIDTNCNEQYNEQNAVGCSNYPVDSDGDAFGSMTVVKCLCEADLAFSTVEPPGSDCDDSDSAINPDAEEVLCDHLNNDCDNETLDELPSEIECNDENDDCDTATPDIPDAGCTTAR